MNWHDEKNEAAADAAREFLDDILSGLYDKQEAKTDLSDYSDSYLHESVIDRDYRPIDAVELLEALDEHEETDSGLWEGADDWRKTLAIIAAYTFGNAVNAAFSELLEAINDDASYLAWELFELESSDDTAAIEAKKAELRAVVTAAIDAFDPTTEGNNV